MCDVCVLSADASGRHSNLLRQAERARQIHEIGQCETKPTAAVYAGTIEGLRGLIRRVGSGTTLAELRTQANPGR